MDTFNPNQMPPMSSLPKEKSVWPIVLVVILLIVIIVGGLYLINSRSSYETPPPSLNTTAIDPIDQQSTSDEIGSIEQDINSTSFDNLDQGIGAIETELQ